MVKKIIKIIALGSLLVVFPLVALAGTFVANSNITVSDVTFGSGTTDLVIMDTSTSASWSLTGGVLTVTNPGTFMVGASDSAVKAIYVTGVVTASVCNENGSPGTSYVTLPTDADTYTVVPSSAADCSQLCATVTGAATYNSYPTCGAASCNNGYTLSGSTCTLTGGGSNGGILTGGGGGGGYTPVTPTYGNGSLLRASGGEKVYLIENNQKRWIPTGEIFTANGYSWASVKVVNDSVLNGFAAGTDVAMVQSPNPTPPDTSSIPEGALIRAKSGIDVYIVKYDGAKKFKRLILSPSVFNSYQHLKWSDVKDIDQSVVDSFVTSNLVRAVNDPKVYELFPTGDTGKKQWIETSSAFLRLGFDWEAVYEINQVDRDSYVTGAAIE